MHIYKSPLPDVAISDRTITDVVLDGLHQLGDKPALIDALDGHTLSGNQVIDTIQRLAGGLTARGLGPGHTIAILAPNVPEYAGIFHGIAYAGATVTTINPSYTEDEVRYQLNDSRAKMLIAHPAVLDTARKAIAGTGVTDLVAIGTAEGTTPLSALMGAPQTEHTPVDTASHIVVLPYSSGTTGLPKGVMLTHRNLVANVAQATDVLDGDAGATLAFLPFFHIYGLEVLMNLYLAKGGTLVTLPRFDLEVALRMIQTHRMKRFFVAPPVVLALAKHPLVDQFDLSSLTGVFCGAAPLGADLTQVAAARLGCAVVQGYGMTEMSPISHFTPRNGSRLGASGVTAPSTLSRIVDPETGLDAAPGEVGELWVKGPQVMTGYLNNAKATEATLTPDGWLKTGDIARIDQDGYMFVVDRVKELIKYKGFQVPPAELEALIVTHPAVADVAVIGVPDEEAGELPMAWVVTKPGATLTLEEVQAHLAPHIAHYKQIRRLSLIDAIPKSASGKILRRLLRGKA